MEIEEDEVRLVQGGHRDRLRPGGRDPGDIEVRERSNQVRERIGKKEVVVDDLDQGDTRCRPTRLIGHVAILGSRTRLDSRGE